MLRLTPDESDPADPVLRIEGSLDASTIATLDALLSGRDTPRALDLTGLRSVDAAGRDLLLRLRAAGAQLRGASVFVRHLLGEP